MEEKLTLREKFEIDVEYIIESSYEKFSVQNFYITKDIIKMNEQIALYLFDQLSELYKVYNDYFTKLPEVRFNLFRDKNFLTYTIFY